MSQASDPYALDEASIKDPPKNFWGMLKYLGPGFILSASIVGSGELISTTILGAEAGFVTLWVILVSCLVKVAVQLEFGKHAINTGEPTMKALNSLPGLKIGKGHWTIWAWLALMSLKMLQVGGIVGGVAIILHMVMPGVDTWVFAFIVAACVSILVSLGYYKLIEKASLAMIALFTVFTLVAVVSLQSTEYAINWADVTSGLSFQLPAAAVVVAIGAFGITGVGGDEIMAYNYWLIEKGYAKHAGPKKDSEEWVRRARGWIKVMYVDALVAMVVYTVVTVAFYLLGAAVLHAQGVVPEKSDLVATLSKMYTETIGKGANSVFLIGAFIVLFSTLFAALAAWTRLFSDAFSQIGMFDFSNERSRKKAIRILAWLLPLGWAALYIWFKAPGVMVIIGGVTTTVILLIVVYAAIYFRYKRLDPRLKPSVLYDVALWLSTAAIAAVAIYGTLKYLT